MLSRVKKEWLNGTAAGLDEENANLCDCAAGVLDLMTLHRKHHMGVDRTLLLARKVFPGMNHLDVKKVVQACK